MLVKPQDLDAVLNALNDAPVVSLDTETTGLRPWQGDRLFSIVCASAEDVFYFDFNGTLPRAIIAESFGPLVNNPSKIVYMHNAKFDMAMLYQDGVETFNAHILDTMVMARLLHNDLMSYSLDSLARMVGAEKDNALKEYALKTPQGDCWDWEIEPGETKRTRRIFFERVPLEIVQPYAEKDARITYDLGVHIMQKLKERDDSRPPFQPSILQCVNSEIETTLELFEMEKTGTLLNREYTREALLHETRRYRECETEFEAATGRTFIDSRKVLAEVFSEHSPEDVPLFGKTEKGNDSFTDAVISRFRSPLAQTVREHRDAYKRAGTYFGNYLFLADNHARVHPNFRQSGTATGRLSCSDPNLQNVTKGKDKESHYPVRRCFVAPTDFFWVSFDYDQMEYRLMLDYAGERSVIEQVLAGLDVHQATANLMGVDRTRAKTINFLLLYGGGPAKLAQALGIKVFEAKDLMALYFSRLPKVSNLIQAIQRQAEARKQIFNWHGRVYSFPDRRFAYKAPNYLIQGGCSDVVKLAMVRAGNRGLLAGKQSRLVLQVHDELDFYIHKNELDLVPQIRGIMESVYPHKYLPLTTGVSISSTSWADVEDFDSWMETQRSSASLSV